MKFKLFLNYFLFTIVFLILLIEISVATVHLDSTILRSNFAPIESSILIPPIEQWNKSFGGVLPDGLVSIQELSDNGFIMVGYTYSYSQGKEDIWLVKTDSNGVEQWNSSFGGASHDEGLSVVETDDNGIMVLGKTESLETQSTDVWLIKTDSSGNKEWDKTFGGNQTDIGRQILSIGNGEYIIIGISQTYEQTGCFIMKINSTGHIQWNQAFDHQFPHSLINVFSVVQSEDNGYFLIGQVYSYDMGSDGFLLKTNHNGQLEWIKTYGGDETEFFKSQRILHDGLILIGTTSSYGSGNYDIWIVKTDLTGNEIWNTTIGGLDFDEGFDIQPCLDDGYIMTGYTHSYSNGQSDVWVIKTDQVGVEQWNKSFGEDLRDVGYKIIETNDLGYAIVGGYNGNGWLLKLNSVSPIHLETSLIFGSINNLEKSNDISWFLSENIILVQFNPIRINRLTSNEKIIIQNQYWGLLTQRIIFGLFQASI
jgi:hypothetical protein